MLVATVGCQIQGARDSTTTLITQSGVTTRLLHATATLLEERAPTRGTCHHRSPAVGPLPSSLRHSARPCYTVAASCLSAGERARDPTPPTRASIAARVATTPEGVIRC